MTAPLHLPPEHPDVDVPVDLDVSAYAIRLGDDALVLAQQLCRWAAWAPELEQDVALLNLALDLLGQARSLLTYAGSREGRGRSEDDLAFLRDEPELVNALLMEVDGGDFARTMARQLYASTHSVLLWSALHASADVQLAGVAGKAVKEAAYHLDHARSWVVRLGDGTAESARRMQAGLDELWPYTFELFETDPLVERLVERGVAADPARLEPQWRRIVSEVVGQATLRLPESTWRPTGGRAGRHTEGFGYLLAEMQHLHRSHPGASW